MTGPPPTSPDRPNPPDVCVIVPLYNSARTIGETIASLRAQSLSRFRAIIVNDASTDDGPALAEHLAGADARFTAVHRPVNGGLAAARNTGLEAALASGARYVYFLDADDWASPHGLRTLVQAADARPGSAVYGGYDLRDDSGSPLGATCRPSAPVVGLSELLEHNRFASHAHLLPLRLLSDTRFDESLRAAEDYDLWLRLAERGVTWRAVDATVASYRVRPTSLSKDFPLMISSVQRAITGAFARARTSGATADTSEARERRVLGRSAFELTTMAAVVRPSPLQAEAAGLYAAATGDKRVPPGVAAGAAYWAFLIGAGVNPASVPARPALGTALGDWWRAAAREGWMEGPLFEAEAAELARLSTTPESVASSLLDLAEKSIDPLAPRLAVLFGCGNNGRALIAAAASRNWTLRVRDDRFSAPGGPELPSGVQPEPFESPIPRGAAVIITPGEDATLPARVSQLPGGAGRTLLRWAQAERALADQSLDRWRAVLTR